MDFSTKTLSDVDCNGVLAILIYKFYVWHFYLHNMFIASFRVFVSSYSGGHDVCWSEKLFIGLIVKYLKLHM